MEATKSKPRCASECSEHVFEIVNHNGNNKHNVRVAFCPKFRRDPYPPEKTIPEFNLDNRYYTQAFVLGTERKFFPRPNEKNSYCSVCKEHFENYYEHIREESHRTKIDAAIYNTEIKRLCDFYKDLWPNSHTKADQIVRELMKQSEMIKKGIKNENDDEDSEEEGSENDEVEDEVEDEDEENQGEEEEEDEEEEYELESEEVGRKKKAFDEEQKEDNNQREKKKRNQGVENRENYTEKIIKQAKQHSEELTQKFNISQTFFDYKPADFVVFLKKNKQGKYRMVRDLDPMLKNGELAEMDEDINEYDNPREDERKAQRLAPKTNRDDKVKEYYKVRKPQPEIEDDENEKDSSDFSLEEGKNGYSIKNNNNVDRIRTRKQQKQDKKQSSTKPEKEYQSHTQKQTTKEPETNNPRAYPSYQMTPQMYEQINVQRMQAHMNKNMGQNPQIMQKMPMMQGHMDPQMQQIPRMPPMQGMQYPPVNFQQGQLPKGPINGSHPYARFYQPGMNMMGYNMPMGGVPASKPDEKKEKAQQQQQQPFPQPQQMYYPQAWGNYMMPQQMMRPDGAEQRGQMVPPMNYQMMQNPNKPPQPGMQPQGQKMGMYYSMDPRYANPYGYAQHMPPSQQYLQKKPEPSKESK